MLNTERRLHDLGYEHRLDLFPGYDHFLFSLRDQWGPGRDWLGDAVVNLDPRHVTYRAFPEIDRPGLGLTHDHAYWISAIAVANGQRSGLVDAISEAISGAEPKMADVLPAGTVPSPHLQLGLEPRPSGIAVPAPSNAMRATLTGVSAVTFWPERAGAMAGSFTLTVTSDRAATITIAGAFGSVVVSVPAGRSTRTVAL